ncbi:MAG: hypothetical protein LBE97_00875 [Holosporales bacterium]|nr:hypothetical protein [Holosporales bacterium]
MRTNYSIKNPNKYNFLSKISTFFLEILKTVKVILISSFLNKFFSGSFDFQIFHDVLNF